VRVCLPGRRICPPGRRICPPGRRICPPGRLFAVVSSRAAGAEGCCGLFFLVVLRVLVPKSAGSRHRISNSVREGTISLSLASLSLLTVRCGQVVGELVVVLRVLVPKSAGSQHRISNSVRAGMGGCHTLSLAGLSLVIVRDQVVGRRARDRHTGLSLSPASLSRRRFFPHSLGLSRRVAGSAYTCVSS